MLMTATSHNTAGMISFHVCLDKEIASPPIPPPPVGILYAEDTAKIGNLGAGVYSSRMTVPPSIRGHLHGLLTEYNLTDALSGEVWGTLPARQAV